MSVPSNGTSSERDAAVMYVLSWLWHAKVALHAGERDGEEQAAEGCHRGPRQEDPGLHD